MKKKKKNRLISIGENVKKLEPLCIVGENVNDTATVESSMVISQKKKIKIESQYKSVIPLQGI